MYKTRQLLIVLMAYFASVIALPAMAGGGSFDEGIEYQLVVPEQATVDQNKIEVVEIFWYGCPHCHQLEPQLKAWLKAQKDDVVFVRLPALYKARPEWETFVRAFYTAQVLGVQDNVHGPLFDAIHVKKQNLNSEDALARFFVNFGVSKDKFHSAFRSFGVLTKVNQARQMTSRYGPRGVPTIIVNGKYRTSASLTGGHTNMLKVVDYLVDKERNL